MYDIDFVRVYSKANEILATSSVITKFPYKIGELVKEQSDIRLCKYSKALEKYGISIKSFGSKSAIWMEYGGANIIFYNEKEVKQRIRFSIGHEYGHFVFGHKMNLKESDPLYKKQEIEANCFSAQLLMPEQLIREATRRGKTPNANFIIESFDVSPEAADRRKETLARYDSEWRKRSERVYDDIILNRFSSFLNTIAPMNEYSSYDYDYEYRQQQEREKWFDTRTRWSK